MPTPLENLETRRDAICAELAAMGPTAAGGKPNSSGADSIDHVGYKDGLYRELDEINKQIAAINSQEPWEIIAEYDV